VTGEKDSKGVYPVAFVRARRLPPSEDPVQFRTELSEDPFYDFCFDVE
jgi:hypothetical protein